MRVTDGIEKAKKYIAVVEPQCWGFEHANFNAALLHTIQLAYPLEEIVFFSEKTHLKYVQDELIRINGNDNIVFWPIVIPERKLMGWRRFISEFIMHKQIYAKISIKDTKVLLFSSVTNTSLLLLKALMKIERFNVPTVAVVHGCLSSIANRVSRRPWNWFIALKHVLLLPHPANLKLIALGDSIIINIKKYLPKSTSPWSAIDMPYLCFSNNYLNKYLFTVKQPLRFGYLGVSSKGFESFCQLADDIAPFSDKANFIMVGFYKGNNEKKLVSKYISNISDKPLPREEYEALVSQITYVVWTAKPDHYQLAASATFLDALAFLKPGIYLRNDYIEYYFTKMGDIGYLCDTYEEMLSIVKNIIYDFPSVRYRKQVENIRMGRVIFEPKSLAPRLRGIIDNQ